jgi:FtsZ-binding cell division protein ZapB
MNLYEIATIEQEIEAMASENEGEISEELLERFLEVQMKTVEKVSNISRYIKHLELFIENCKEEKKRISENQRKAENRIESIKRYMTPLVMQHYGGKLDAGTFKISTRSSESVELEDGFNLDEYCDVVIEYKADKKKIKDAIKSGVDVPGAKIKSNINLQIK